MKDYPSIPREIQQGMSIYAFDKIDGSNIRSEWNRKQKFYKFGSRSRLLGSDQAFISEAKDLIISKYEDDLTKIFNKNNWERVIVFFEFFGKNSFAGIHQTEPHDVVMFDVNPYKKGILPPKEYLDHFGHLDIAKILYHGPCDGDFIRTVKTSSLDGMTCEGVVCKAKNPKQTNQPVMFKIKSDAWINKLKATYNTEKFNQLL